MKKTAATVMGAAVSSTGVQAVFGLSSGSSDQLGISDPISDVDGNPIAKTASWLDRAKNVLKEPSADSSADEQTQGLESQIQEVQRLIHEGPSIQQTSHALPHILEHPDDGGGVAAESVDDEHAEKRLRTAEDAEALVGFLRSVRASAAQGDTF